MVVAFFSINDKDKKSHFFKETFLLAEISINITFEMHFFTLGNIQITFNNQRFR